MQKEFFVWIIYFNLFHQKNFFFIFFAQKNPKDSFRGLAIICFVLNKNSYLYIQKYKYSDIR